MPLEVVKHNAPKLGKVKMTCDNPIDPKLEESGEAVKCCFSKPNFTILSGGMGSGKTSWIISALKGFYKKTHHDIIVVIPEISLHSISERDNVFEKYCPPENLYHELNEDVLEEIYAKAQANAAEDRYTMLIIDDFGADLKTKPVEKVLQRLVIKMRHLKLGGIFVLCQNYFQMPKKLRELATNCVLWNSNKSQNKKFFLEQMQTTEEEFEDLLKHCPTIHNWFLLNLKYKRIFTDNWHEVVLKN